MTPEQKNLVQASFAKVLPIADKAATIFYEDLFARDPSLRFMFSEDLTQQKRKLMSMLGNVVSNLKNWDQIASAVQALGARHDAYGVNPEHYESVGASLIATLEKGLGRDFTPDVRAAWVACYRHIADEMSASY